jgi:hypothetical protein
MRWSPTARVDATLPSRNWRAQATGRRGSALGEAAGMEAAIALA